MPFDHRLTVVICTRNRARSLRLTLETLEKAAATTKLKWELLLIDNGSSDETKDVSAHFGERLPLRYMFESKTGLSYARNRAIAEARGEFIIFTDDDVNISPGWLEAYESLLKRCPQVAFAGGKIIPCWEIQPPTWVIKYAASWLNGVVVWYDGGEKEWLYDLSRDPFYGANFGVSVKAIKEIGGFDIRLGRKDAGQLGAEEMQVEEALAKKGCLGVYLPDAVVYHRIESCRWRKKFILRSSMGHGRVRIIRRKVPLNVFFKCFYKAGLLLRMLFSGLLFLSGQLLRCPRIWLPGLCFFGWAVGEWQEVGYRQQSLKRKA